LIRRGSNSGSSLGQWSQNAMLHRTTGRKKKEKKKRKKSKNTHNENNERQAKK
jgi:hypothetical protein